MLQYIMLRQRVGDNNVDRALRQRVEKDNVHRANNELKDVCQKPFTPETPQEINFLIGCGATLAGWACCLASHRGNVETANFLIEEHGVSPFQAVWGAADGRGGGVVLDYFLERYDMDPEHISSMEGETLLHRASLSGNHEMVRHLLGHSGVDINARTNSNDGNETALDKAEYRWYDGMDDEEEEDERRAICIDILLQHGAVRGVDLPTPVTSSDDEE